LIYFVELCKSLIVELKGMDAMNRIETFQQFLATQSVQVPILEFLFGLSLAAILSGILSKIYITYGKSLSNRRMFAENFMLLTVATMLVISIVKSSLALSLGLVGALSIVRFRAAIKEPEELSYLFVAIAIGLGLGANQVKVTIVAFLFISLIIILKSRSRRDKNGQNLHLTVSSSGAEKVGLDRIVEVLERNCSVLNMRRFDESSEALEAAFWIEFESIDQFRKTRSELQGLGDSVTITFLDSTGGI